MGITDATLGEIDFKLVCRCQAIGDDGLPVELRGIKFRPFTEHVSGIEHHFFGACANSSVLVYSLAESEVTQIADFSPMPEQKDECYYTICWASSSAVRKEYICVAGTSGMIQVIDFTEMKYGKTIIGHTGKIFSLATHPLRLEIVASGSLDESVRIWNVETADCLIICGGFMAGHLNGIVNANWNFDGSKLVTSGKETMIKIWSIDLDTLDEEKEDSKNRKRSRTNDLNTGIPMPPIPAHEYETSLNPKTNQEKNDENPMFDVSFRLKDDLREILSERKNMKRRHPLIKLIPKHTCSFVEGNQNALCTVFVKDMLISWCSNGILKLWDPYETDAGCYMPDGESKVMYGQYLDLAEIGEVRMDSEDVSFAINTCCTYVAVGCWNGDIMLFDLIKDGGGSVLLKNPFPNNDFNIASTDISRKGKYIASCGNLGRIVVYKTVAKPK